MDALIGRADGLLHAFRNNGDGTFTELAGAANPFSGVDVGFGSAPTFADVDGDGDLDVVTGDMFGYLRLFRNDAPHGREIAVTVTRRMTRRWRRRRAGCDRRPCSDLHRRARSSAMTRTVTATREPLQSVTAGTGGSVVLNADGGVTFTPTPTSNGPAHFTYVVGDGHGGTTKARGRERCLGQRRAGAGRPGAVRHVRRE